MRHYVILCMLLAVQASSAQSAFTSRIDDPKAQYLEPPSGDATGAIQAAIDRVQETTGEGILFVAEGRYSVSRTIYVWPGIRIIGYGARRPVMVLAPNTPGYSSGVADMFFYAGYRPLNRGSGAASFPRGPETPPGTYPPTRLMPDANPGTFYSAMSNIDFEIGEGNAGAVAIRFHAAQHSYLSHIDFHTGSGLAALHDIGNEGEDLHFYGGRYGILTRKPSPAWQYTLIDSTFEGQREAAIRENEAGLALINCRFKDVPTAVAIDRGYSDDLYIKDAVFDNIAGPAILISNEESRMTHVNGENILCRRVPTFARFRESGRTLAGKGETYRVKVVSHGLTLSAEAAPGKIETRYEAEPIADLPAPLPAVIRPLPPVSEWVSVAASGAKGDGKTDDTAAIRKAVAEHKVVYLPMGYYIVTGTIELTPDTVMIALHPDLTQLYLPDRTPAFQGPNTPLPLLATPLGGSNVVSGIGIFTGGINSRAVGALWRAGQNSLMNDVRFHGGHGTSGLNGQRINPYNNTHTADPDLRRRWDAQYPSLWVKGGGGTFVNIWTPDTFSQTGLYVSDTEIPGRVYELSSEHHVRNELMFKNVANWELVTLQTEGEVGESAYANSLEIDNCRNLTFANFHGYRVVRSYNPFPYAVRISHSTGIRFRNFHVDNNSSIASCDPRGENCRQLVRAGKVGYADAIVNDTNHAVTRDREFANLDIGGKPFPAVVTPGIARIASGFFNLSGGVASPRGDLYFADPRWHRIYKWDAAARDLTIVRQTPLEPVNLALDNSGSLIVVSYGGTRETVYSFKPGTPDDEMTLIEREPAQPRPGMKPILPVDYWVNGDFSNTLDTATYEYRTLDEMFREKMATRKPWQYVSLDKSVFIPANEVFNQGEPYFAHKWTDILMPTGLVQAGRKFYVTNEAEQKTYSAVVNNDGTLSNLKLFAHQGGESLAIDKAGNVYIAAGQIHVYNPEGKQIRIICTPDRPTHLVIGGNTLYVLSHNSVHSLKLN